MVAPGPGLYYPDLALNAGDSRVFRGTSTPRRLEPAGAPGRYVSIQASRHSRTSHLGRMIIQ